MEHTEVVLAEGIACFGKAGVYFAGGGVVPLFVGGGSGGAQSLFFVVVEGSQRRCGHSAYL